MADRGKSLQFLFALVLSMTLAQPPHKKAKALKPGATRPAKELCSECGLFADTYYIHYVKEACAFLNQQFPHPGGADPRAQSRSGQ